VKHLRLLDRVAAERTVDHQPAVLRRGGVVLLQHAADLRQLLHEVALGVQPAGRVHDQKVAAARLGGLPGIESHRRRIGAGVAGHELDLEPRGPRLQLLDRGRAEGVAGRDGDGLARPA
jgi:hypothetical protein